MNRRKYKADIAGGSLKLPESRIIAGLLLDKVSPKNGGTRSKVRTYFKSDRPVPLRDKHRCCERAL